MRSSETVASGAWSVGVGRWRILCNFPNSLPGCKIASVYADPMTENFFFGNFSLLVSLKQGITPFVGDELLKLRFPSIQSGRPEGEVRLESALCLT